MSAENSHQSEFGVFFQIFVTTRGQQDLFSCPTNIFEKQELFIWIFVQQILYCQKTFFLYFNNIDVFSLHCTLWIFGQF